MTAKLFNAVAFACSYFIVAASPGPNLIVISRAGLIGSRATATQTAVGVVLGASALTVFAVSSIRYFPQDRHVMAFAEYVFVVLLLHWSIQAFRRALSGAAGEPWKLRSDHRHLRRGFVTAASNPFTAAFLATAVDADLTPLDAVEIVFVVASLWFGSISLICCHQKLHIFYESYRRYIEAVFGFAFLGMLFKGLSKIIV